MLFPDSFVVKDFLNQDELSKLRELFKNRKAEFKYGTNESGQLSQVCRTHQLIESTSKTPWLKTKFEKAFQELQSFLELKNQKLSFETFYFKIYLENDFYGTHVDSSPTNLTFLYQFTSEKSNIHFPALEFEDGTHIPFESNQLIIFHSSRPHAFEKMQKVSDPNVYKCLVQCLPDFL